MNKLTNKKYSFVLTAILLEELHKKSVRAGRNFLQNIKRKNSYDEKKSATIKKQNFTTEEDDIIRKYYPIGGSNLVLKHFVAQHHSEGIRNRANWLGIKLSKTVLQEIHKDYSGTKLSHSHKCGINRLYNKADKNWNGPA